MSINARLLTPAASDRVARCALEICECAEQIKADARDGSSPLESTGAPGLWLKSLELYLAALKVAAADGAQEAALAP